MPWINEFGEVFLLLLFFGWWLWCLEWEWGGGRDFFCSFGTGKAGSLSLSLVSISKMRPGSTHHYTVIKLTIFFSGKSHFVFCHFSTSQRKICGEGRWIIWHVLLFYVMGWGGRVRRVSYIWSWEADHFFNLEKMQFFSCFVNMRNIMSYALFFLSQGGRETLKRVEIPKYFSFPLSVYCST